MPRWFKLVGLSILIVAGILIVIPIAKKNPLPTDSPAASNAPLEISLRHGVLSVDGHQGTMLHDDVLALVGKMRSGEATASDSVIEFRGIASASSQWSSALSSFRNRLPADTDLALDVFVIDDALDIGEACGRMFDAIDDAEVTFHYSGSELRSSSFAALDRLIDFAADCSAASILIIGHSDDSGETEFNQLLSLRRAQAVADYLNAGGVPMWRLEINGRGSSEPIADNETVHGRAQNRRIEFELVPQH